MTRTTIIPGLFLAAAFSIVFLFGCHKNKGTTPTPVYPSILCGSFEDSSCFSTYWTVNKYKADQVLRFDKGVSHNSSTSLYLSTPYKDTGAINLSSIDMSTYVAHLSTGAVYKVQWWAKYSGFSAKDNGPVMYCAAATASSSLWLSYLELGSSDGSYKSADWQQYSFQFTPTDSLPIQILFGSNLQNCWIDDMEIIKLQ